MKKVLALLCALLAAPAAAQIIPSGPVGAINYWGVGGLSQVLNPGLAGQCLTTQGVGSAPVWVNCQVSSLSLLPPINTNQFYGNVSGQFSPPVGVDVNTVLNTVGYDIVRPPTPESIIYKSNVGPLFNWQALPPGVSGSVLTSGGPTNPPFWASQGQAVLTNICSTVGAILYFDTPSLSWKCLNPAAAGSVLETGGASANPSWVGGSALTANNDTNVTAALSGTPGSALLQPVSIAMGWTGTLAAGRLNSNVVQSFTNDTNVTASISAQNATLGWTGTLAVARGGTGAGTQAGAAANVFPTPTRAGDVAYWNGSAWVTLPGNNSGTNFLTENPSGVPAWASIGAGVTSFNSLAGVVTTSVVVQKFTASGTYTPTAGMLHAVIECIGGGGAGGGAAGSSTGVKGGHGGNSGGYSRKYTTAAAVGVSQTVTIGAGGAPGAAGDVTGGAGGDTSVGTLCVGKGGPGGAPGAADQQAAAVAGTGDIAFPGNVGFPGYFATVVTANPVIGGGAPSYLSGGARGQIANDNTPGIAAAANSGAGGGGAAFNSVTTTGAGGAGGSGVVIITEYVNL